MTLVLSQPQEKGLVRPLISGLGYDWAVALLSFWMVAGVHLDAWAHPIFPIETFFTPRQLAVGGALISSGPLRAALGRRSSRAPGLPALVSLALLLAVLAFFTAYAHPLIEAADPGHAGDRAPTITSVLLQTGVLMGGVLFALSRRRFPFESFTLALTPTST